MKLDWSVVWDNAGLLADGAKVTVLLTATTMAIAVPTGVVLAAMRLSHSRVLSTLSAAYSGLFRNLPLLLIIYVTYYVMPVTLGLRFDPFTTAVIALWLSVSAVNSDTFRSGIGSIRKGQSEAALALGMSDWQVAREVVLPQATRRILPVLASTWVSLFKDTSLVSVVSIGELAYTAMRLRATTFRVLEVLTAMAVIYWAMGYPQAKFTDWLHRRFGVAE